MSLAASCRSKRTWQSTPRCCSAVRQSGHQTRDAKTAHPPDALNLATASLFEDIDAVVCGDSKWLNVLDVSVEIRLLRERDS